MSDAQWFKTMTWGQETLFLKIVLNSLSCHNLALYWP